MAWKASIGAGADRRARPAPPRARAGRACTASCPARPSSTDSSTRLALLERRGDRGRAGAVEQRFGARRLAAERERLLGVGHGFGERAAALVDERALAGGGGEQDHRSLAASLRSQPGVELRGGVELVGPHQRDARDHQAVAAAQRVGREQVAGHGAAGEVGDAGGVVAARAGVERERGEGERFEPGRRGARSGRCVGAWWPRARRPTGTRARAARSRAPRRAGRRGSALLQDRHRAHGLAPELEHARELDRGAGAGRLVRRELDRLLEARRWPSRCPRGTRPRPAR